MKTAISSWSYRYFFEKGEMNLLSFLDEVKDKGAEGFEIFPSYIDDENPQKHLQDVMNKANELGLEVSSLIAGNDFARPSITERAKQVEDMKEKIRIAENVGISRMNVFTGYHTEGQDPVMEVMRVVDCYREVVPLAEEKNIQLCIENHSSVAADADGLLAVITAVDSPMLFTNPDPTNFLRHHSLLDEDQREVIYKETEKIAPRMANAHIKVNTYDSQGQADNVDVQRLVSIFKNVGYDGHIVLEYFGQGDPRDSMTSGLKLLDEVLGRVG